MYYRKIYLALCHAYKGNPIGGEEDVEEKDGDEKRVERKAKDGAVELAQLNEGGPGRKMSRHL